MDDDIMTSPLSLIHVHKHTLNDENGQTIKGFSLFPSSLSPKITSSADRHFHPKKNVFWRNVSKAEYWKMSHCNPVNG